MKSRIRLCFLIAILLAASVSRLQRSDSGVAKGASFQMDDRVIETQLDSADLGYINPNIGIGWGSFGERPPIPSAHDIATQEAQWEVHRRAYERRQLEPAPSTDEWAKIAASTNEYFQRLKERLTDSASLTSNNVA